MLAFAARRLVLAVLVAVTVSVICFCLLHLSGDLAQALAGQSSSASDVEATEVCWRCRPAVSCYEPAPCRCGPIRRLLANK